LFGDLPEVPVVVTVYRAQEALAIAQVDTVMNQNRKEVFEYVV
jgi:hypothetical protein